jgi:hypothetical protein
MLLVDAAKVRHIIRAAAPALLGSAGNALPLSSATNVPRAASRNLEKIAFQLRNP